MLKILIVEDDEQLSQNVKDILEELGEVDQVYDGEEAVYQLSQDIYDFAVLDLMLPLMNGHQVLQEIREQQIATPILILTAKEGIENKLKGFTLGADDYLTKPFHREELLLRAKALLRRTHGLFQENIIVCGAIKCDLNQRTVCYQENEIHLQGKEFEIFVYLIQNRKRIITKEQIFDRVWGFDSMTSMTVVEVYISHLRKHLRSIGLNDSIKTVRHMGYLFEMEEEEA